MSLKRAVLRCTSCARDWHIHYAFYLKISKSIFKSCILKSYVFLIIFIKQMLTFLNKNYRHIYTNFRMVQTYKYAPPHNKCGGASATFSPPSLRPRVYHCRMGKMVTSVRTTVVYTISTRHYTKSTHVVRTYARLTSETCVVG